MVLAKILMRNSCIQTDGNEMAQLTTGHSISYLFFHLVLYIDCFLFAVDKLCHPLIPFPYQPRAYVSMLIIPYKLGIIFIIDNATLNKSSKCFVRKLCDSLLIKWLRYLLSEKIYSMNACTFPVSFLSRISLLLSY